MEGCVCLPKLSCTHHMASFEMFSPKFLVEDDQANLPREKKKGGGLFFEQDEVSCVDLQRLLVVVVVQVECAEMGDAGNGEVFVSDVLQLGCTWNCKITG